MASIQDRKPARTQKTCFPNLLLSIYNTPLSLQLPRSFTFSLYLSPSPPCHIHLTSRGVEAVHVTQKNEETDGEKVFALQFTAIICPPPHFFSLPHSASLLPHFTFPLPSHFQFPLPLFLPPFVSFFKNTYTGMCLWLIVSFFPWCSAEVDSCTSRLSSALTHQHYRCSITAECRGTATCIYPESVLQRLCRKFFLSISLWSWFKMLNVFEPWVPFKQLPEEPNVIRPNAPRRVRHISCSRWVRLQYGRHWSSPRWVSVWEAVEGEIPKGGG